MMISPEAYYEFEVKGKAPDEIEKEIQELKKQISDLKYRMEDPEYRPRMICPSDGTVLYWTREYLAMAKKALIEVGGTYAETDEDRRAAEFLENLPFLVRLEFTHGSFGPDFPIVINCGSEELRWNDGHDPFQQPFSEPPWTRTVLLDRIRELHLEEWQSDYWPDKYGIHFLDGIQWELKLEYSNGHEPWTIFGSNAYPYNFRELLDLLGEYSWLDTEYEEEDDTDEE